MLDIKKVTKVFYSADELLNIFGSESLNKAREEIYTSENWGCYNPSDDEDWDFEEMEEDKDFIDFCNTNELYFLATGELQEWDYINTNMEKLANKLLKKCIATKSLITFSNLDNQQLLEIAKKYLPKYQGIRKMIKTIPSLKHRCCHKHECCENEDKVIACVEKYILQEVVGMIYLYK